jgi:hypothetical protein
MSALKSVNAHNVNRDVCRSNVKPRNHTDWTLNTVFIEMASAKKKKCKAISSRAA